MELYSTNNPAFKVDLKRAVLEGLAPDKGLYMPSEIIPLSPEFFEALPDLSLAEIGFEVCKAQFKGQIPDADLWGIISRAINFPAPLHALNQHDFILELFHGPSLAFKDFGARFMAELMGYFMAEESGELIILVATSGDTGGAVAAGFYNVPGIRVGILYPSGRVSAIQEKQLTTLGANITAFEIDGSFDDCQAMVKQAFLDQELNRSFRLSSANSINIARLIPQSFYYFEAYKQLLHKGIKQHPVFVVPSGNFGNLTAGVFAHKMGMPVNRFIAATNANHVIPDYLATGVFSPMESVATISNAMDVGNPSNFPRLLALYADSERSTWNNFIKTVLGYWFDDRRTKEEILAVLKNYNYLMDPHTAVGTLALGAFRNQYDDYLSPGVVLGTAHYGKFLPVVKAVVGDTPPLPESLERLKGLSKVAVPAAGTYQGFKSAFLQHFK